MCDAFFVSNIREIWRSYDIKHPEEIKNFIGKSKDRRDQLTYGCVKGPEHSGFILHKEDVRKVDEKYLLEIQREKRIKYNHTHMNVFFSVPEDFVNRFKQEAGTKTEVTTDEHQRSIIKIKTQKRPELTEESFLSNRDKLVRLNRSKQDFRSRFVSPEQRVGTQLRPLRSSKGSLVTRQQLEDLQVRPETEKAHKRILSSGLSMSKQSTGVPSKVLKGFGISVRTLYGKHTPINFSNFSGAQTPVNEYAETSKSWIVANKRQRRKDEYEQKSRISKNREIEKIMKKLGKAEQDRNVTIFKNLIKEEKDLHKELIKLDNDQRQKELQRKKFMVFRANKRRSLAKLDREFALTFAQHKNIIAKHASIGEKRRRENEYLDHSHHIAHNKSNVKNLKHQTEDSVTTFRSFVKSHKYNPPLSK